eukprot:TRINITY_DN16885_c1_g1_i1.p1 TRINITY_DN16885_c1_g1~~TRINITY_DN16885_c1_g1_i1.p1  ORF type:complete len:470 (+),score=114.00 TRINITY_DN16885_c1_g1_i1:25-1410(+)
MSKAPNLAAVRIFPVVSVNESAYPEIFDLRTSPNAFQGLLQYFRLVEGCISLIQSHEQARGFRYKWIVRTRVDGFWKDSPPPLETLNEESYHVPYGSAWRGYNDRYGAGNWSNSLAALSRLHMLNEIQQHGYKGLNSEMSFKAQLDLRKVNVTEMSLPFCVLSRRVYLRKKVLTPVVFSIDSMDSLNGAKCRPCIPRSSGKKAQLEMSQIPQTAGHWVGPNVRDVNVCDETKPWEDGWEKRFDQFVGSKFAASRKEIMDGMKDNCEVNMEKLQKKAKSWDAPPPSAICMRARLGKESVLGSPHCTFATFLDVLNPSSVVFSAGNSSEDMEWVAAMERSVPGLKVVSAEKEGAPRLSGEMEKTLRALGTQRLDVLKMSTRGLELGVLSEWRRMRQQVKVCQLLLSFPLSSDVFRRMEKSHILLRKRGLHLDSCRYSGQDTFLRCTFFSILYCQPLNPKSAAT